MQPSITPQYDPDHPPWQRVIAYTMTIEKVAVFRTACERLNDGNVQQALLAAAYGGRTVPRAGHEAEDDDTDTTPLPDPPPPDVKVWG